MKKMQIRGTVTVESERVFVARSGRAHTLQHCPKCQRCVAMVTPEEAARRMGLTTRSIYRCVELEIIHYIDTANNELLVCLESSEGHLATEISNSGEEK